jgi:pilus assembly protein FimV
MVSKLKTGAAFALLLSASLAIEAAGLGKLTVNSALGQVLNAEIDLVSLQPGELDSLTARVASAEAFRDARVEYSPALRLLRFSVEKRPNGQPYLKVTSAAPINEPFVDVLLEVTWPAGRIQREYPILLDPPGYSQARVAAPTVAAAPTPSPAPATRAPDTPPATEPAAAPSSPASSAAGTPSAQAELGASAPRATAGDNYGPVEKGETLSKIAGQVKPSDVSLEQMLVALYRQNQAAFAGNNMNRLKTGQILRVPTAEEAAQIAPAEAGRELRTHVSDWKTYREQVASGTSTIAPRADSSNAASGRVASAAVTPPAPPSAESKDSLRLSKSDATGKSAAAGKSGGGGQERVNALQEEVVAKDKALRESQSRVADLEKQIQTMQRLLDLKSGAAATKPADTKVAAAPTPTPAPVPAPVPVPAKPDEPKVATVTAGATPTADAPKAGETPAADATKAATPPPVVADASKTPPAKTDTPPKAVVRKAPPPKSFVDELLDNPAYLAIGAGAIGALLLGGFIFARRRRNRDDLDSNSSMTSAFPSDLKPNTNTGKSGGGLVDTGNSSFLTDFDKTGPGTIDTDEVDPVAEAEVYIAYGRDAQAEEILKEAMARDKNRHEIALKLLEIYHARKSATAFETVAKELRSAVGENHPLWQKAAAMGAQIDPTNPLYVAAAAGTATFTAMSSSAAPAAPARPDLDFDLDTSSSSGSSGSSPAPTFDLDLDTHRATPDLHTDKPGEVDFDLAPGGEAPMDMPSQSQKEEKPTFDFDLSGLDFPASKGNDSSRAGTSSSGAPGVDLADLSLDSPSSGEGGEAVGTKLELAKAYLEIGDKDGARDILHEVAKEGSAAQKEEAKKLIASL